MNEKIKYGEMTDSDLKNRLTEVSAELHGARQKVRTGTFKKFSEFTRLRREIARINTNLRARALKAQAQA